MDTTSENQAATVRDQDQVWPVRVTRRGDAVRPLPPQVPGKRLSSLRPLLNAFSSWRRRRRQKAELYALSDAALKDFGVSRWEIEGIVDSPNRDASGRVR